MAVTAHAEFHWPEDPSVTVWRYLDLAKYLSMLESNALFFSRLDKLNDPFEGSRPRATIEAKDASLALLFGGLGAIEPEETAKRVAEIKRLDSTLARAMTRWCAANCWHLGEHESAAMWDVYMRTGAGVAIRSTFDRLKASFVGDEVTVYMGEVTYIDYSEDVIPTGNLLTPVLCKRKSFEHESELRVLVFQTVFDVDGKPDPEASAWDAGVEVDVDLRVLVEAVHVSPTAPDWFAGLVASVTTRYGFKWDVSQSRLLEDPLF